MPISLPLTQPVAIVTLVLALILFAPMLFRRLKVPDIVGLIVAGILVGPYGFNLLERDASFRIFGQVGILYLMFLAAAEINMSDLQANFRRGLVFGLLTFALPMGAGVAGAMWAFGASAESAVLIASMYASHTLVSYPIVSKFRLQNSPGAVIAVCGTIVAVLLALLALAEVVAIRQSGSFDAGGLAMMLAMTVVYGVGLGYGFPWLTRLFFRKISQPVAQYIFIMGEMLFASLLAQLIGLESILGAFYAGLVLNRLIPGGSGLARNITFVGNAIFIPYFLIGVGMLINPAVIVRSWKVGWIALNMVGVALAAKWLAAWATQRIYRLSSVERRLVFGLSSGKAAATIAATMVGYQWGLLDEDLMNGSVVMILVCCLVSTITTERAAIRMRIAETAAEMERDGVESPLFARQVVAVANPLTSAGLARMAAYMRNPRNTHELTLAFVRATDDPRLRMTGRGALREAREAAEEMDLEVKEVERFDLNTAMGLANIARENRATDILLGFHRKSTIVDTFHGPIVETLMGASDRMLIMSRCFIPVDTIRELVVVCWRNAQYEPGFHAWVARLGNLASQLGCRMVVLATPETSHFIEEVIREDGYGVRRTYRCLESWDDFILLSGSVMEEDLMVVVGARKGSVSWNAEMESIPGFLQRHFQQQNLMIIYPGSESLVSTPRRDPAP